MRSTPVRSSATQPARVAARVAALALLALTATMLPPQTAHARGGMSWIGLDHDLRVDGSYSRGSRWTKAGNQYLVTFEGATFGKVSPLGNLAGLEFGAAMGYDGVPYRASDQVLGDLGFLFDMSVGFPVTLVNLLSGGKSRLMLGVSPGFGISMVSAYTYLKAKALFRLSNQIVLEGQWTWWPGAASHPVGETNNSVNAAALRGTAYFKLSRSTALLGYLELYQGQREEELDTGGNSSKVLFGGVDPFGSTKRYAYEDFLRFGVGYAF